MALDVYATLHKSDKHLVLIHSLGSLVFSIHYFVLGAFAGALSEFLNGTRTGLSAYFKSNYLGWFFIALYGVLLIIIPADIFAALPFISSILITVGLYFFQSVKMRLFYMAGFALWLIYSIKVLSVGGILLFITLLCTSSYTIYKLYRDQNA